MFKSKVGTPVTQEGIEVCDAFVRCQDSVKGRTDMDSKHTDMCVVPPQCSGAVRSTMVVSSRLERKPRDILARRLSGM